jgi:hopanoid biosynthesis associated protein HpnK
LIVTADDFGLSREVNEAVEVAHTRGILSAASLMVNGAAAGDAIERARRMRSLRVGLHLVLVDGVPTLPPDEIPDLVDDAGCFDDDLGRAGRKIFFDAKARQQLTLEIGAQFDAYKATGLPLDHVNAHHHFHVHPTVGSHLFAIGPRYGMRALRVPLEPRAMLNRIDRSMSYRRDWQAEPWARLLRARAKRRGMVTNDRVFGLAWSGAMSAARMSALLTNLPAGVTEIYTHPAMTNTFEGASKQCDYTGDLAALISSDVVAQLRAIGVRAGGYSDVA